jgi:hypothetical protein
MSNINVTITLSEDDRTTLGGLFVAIQQLTEALNGSTVSKNTEEPVTPSQSEAPSEETTPVDTIPAEEEKPVEAKSEPAEAIDVDKLRAEVQSLVVKMSAAGKKAQVRDIVLAYGNTNVSTVPEDKLTEVKEKLTALEG